MKNEIKIGIIVAIIGGVTLKFITDYMDKVRFSDMSEQDQMIWEQNNLWN